MSATVDHVASITLRLEDGENLQLENAYVLTSYASRVAVFCKMRCYLLPRYDCSVTTWKHVHAFINDFCDYVPDMSAADIRATSLPAWGVRVEISSIASACAPITVTPRMGSAG